MASIEQILEKNCSDLESNKVTERRKALEEFKDLLESAEVLQVLNKNSKKNAGGRISWDNIFAAAHRAAIQEATKIREIEAKKESPSQTLRSGWANLKSAFGSFIVTVVNKANLGEPRLRCSDLISSVKTVLSSSYLIECYVRSYMHILDRHVLLVRKYWADAKPSEWEELMEKFWELLDNTPTSMDKALVTSILRRIIKCGAMQSHLALKLRTRFVNLANALKNPDIKNNNDLQCNLLELAIMVCEQVAKESRMVVCEFGEDVLMSVIHLYEHKIERTAGKKSFMFKFLTLQVRLHHPKGAKEGEAATYAKDWLAWKKQCRSLYTMIESEIRYLKRHSPLLKDFFMPPDFLELAVAVCKQVYENESNVFEVTQLTVLNETMNVTSENVPKRRRVDVGLQAVIDLLGTCNDPFVVLPWLAILTELLSTYPSLVKHTDFLPLLTLVSVLQSACDEPIVLQHLCRYCVAMLKVESELDSDLLDDTSTLWGKILEFVLRIVSLSQCEESGHLLLQALLSHGKVATPTTLLLLYLTDAVKLSLFSVRTLGMVCQHWDIPDSITLLGDHPVTPHRGKTVLLDWLLPAAEICGTDLVVHHSLVLADTLVRLILKNKIPDGSCNLVWKFNEREESIKVFTSSIEDHYILCSFENDNFLKKSEASVPKNIIEEHKCRINSTMKEKLIDVLKRNSAQQEDKMLMPPSESECMSAVLGMISNVSLLASVLSCMLKCGIITHEEVPDHSLSDTICSQLLRVSTFATPLIRKHDTGACGIVSRLRFLLDLNLEKKVSQFVRQSLPVDLVEAVCTLLPRQRILRNAEEVTFDEERSQRVSVSVSGSDGDHEIMFDGAGSVRLQASMMLKSYLCGSGGSIGGQHSRLISQILDLMASREFNYKEECDFTMAEGMLNGIVRLETISREVIHQVLRVLQAMCVARYQECLVASSLLTIVTGLVPHVSACGSDASKQNIIIVMEGFRSGIKRKKYGIFAYSKFLGCIAQFLKVDPLGTWSKWNGTHKTLGEDILGHMTSPFHEIRMDCAQYVQLMFSSTLEERALQRQKQLFEDVRLEVMASFSVDDDLSPREMADEGVNRTASALHTVTSLVVASPYIHRKAVYFFLELIHKKNINLGLAAKVLRHIGNYFKLKAAAELIKYNLDYCIHYWFKDGYQMQSFPYKLIGCSSLLQFYNQHKNILVPAVLKSEDEQAFNELAQKMNCTVSDLVTGCFPEIMACLLPCLAVKDSNDHCGITETELNIAQRLHSHLQRIIGQEAINNLITSHISEVIVGVMKVLHDPDHLAELCGSRSVLPETCPPVFRAQVILKVFEHLQESCPQSDVPLILVLSQIVPDQVHKILRSLVANIYQAPTQEDKLLAFHCYATFVDATSLQLAEPSGLDEMTVFVMRDICHTLMHLVAVGGDSPLVSVAACHFFQRFCRKCLPARGKDISQFLYAIVGYFVPIIGQELSPLRKHAKAVLNCLVVDNEAYLADAISRLDPFPDGSEFEGFQAVYQRLKYTTAPFSLRDEMQHFLNAGHGNITRRVEGLKHLRQQLSKKKEELCDLYEELQTLRGFSEDCAKSIIHRLVSTLVGLTLGSDEQVSTEASGCLGELGPADLTTMILKPERSLIAKTGQASTLEALLGCAIEMLTGYLTESNLKLVSVSSDALYNILCTPEGRFAAEKQIKFKGTLKRAYLTPFLHGNISGVCGMDVNEVLVKKEVDQNYLWASGDIVSHDSWIMRLTCALLGVFAENDVFRHIAFVCREKASFCEYLLPYLIDNLLRSGNDVCHTVVSSNMRKFFQKHCEEYAALSANSISPAMRKRCADQIVLNKSSVQSMLNVVQHIRLQGASLDGTAQSLDLDYLHVAQAAQFCCAHFTSILYAELCCAQLIKDDQTALNEPNNTILDYIYEHNPEHGAVIQRILRDAYTKLNYGDAVFGCGSHQLLEPSTRVQHLELEGKWEQAAHEYELLVMRGNKAALRGLALALCRLGSYHMLSYLTAGRDKRTSGSEDLTDLHYECSWRLRQWHLETLSEDVYEGHHYAALHAMFEGDAAAVCVAERRARLCVVKELAEVSMESVKNIYPALSRLQALRELNDFEVEGFDSLDNVLETWSKQDKLVPSEFEFVEPILSQRATMLSVACDRMEGSVKNKLFNVFVNAQLKTAALACKEEWLHTASACLSSLSRVADMSWEQVFRLKLEEAQVLWLQGNTEMAKCMLRTLLGNLQQETVNESPKHALLCARALGLYGNWMVETKSENPLVIIKEYFFPALDNIKNIEMNRDVMAVRLETCASLARFADFQYQHLTRYISSPEFEVKQKGIAESRQMAEQMQRETHIKDKKVAYTRLTKQSEIDQQEIQSVLEEKDMYLSLAAKHYCLTLEYGDKYNLLVFRIASLWLQNTEHTEVINVLGDRLPQIPSYKFLELLPQLSARISNEIDNPFIASIHSLLERCALDHPHHTLPVLLAISNLHLDQKYTDPAYAKTIAKNDKEPRVLGAQRLVHHLSCVKKIATILDQMKKLSEALVSFAYHNKIPNTTASGKQYPVPDSVKKIRNFDQVLVPSVSLPVVKTGHYEDIVGVKCFEKTFTTVGGINVPKKILCIGTDGVKRPLLVKGRDDLRQDAVMQQVFTIMNALLKSNKETKKRKLLIRTYKVVPLSQRSGVIEWCENTQPLSYYLSDPQQNLHKRYYPSDLPVLECRARVQNAATASSEEKLKVFKEICKRLRPAFHHFFLENFRTPAMWFERRQAYVHSVATSSMVGYILGLGDRHVLNILIDVSTAEVIHIDFGIAFEQGKVLPTPETIPFRLTRDIVDGMGVSGVEGVFRRSCEKTMLVLRENQETIHTILEVLLYDPLYAWTVTPAKASDIQNNKRSSIKQDDTTVMSSEVNMQAERALLRLRQKLNGTEDGMVVTSVPGQVNRLLQQARDPARLACLYQGWQAYL